MSPIVRITKEESFFSVARPTPSISDAGSFQIISLKCSFGIQVTASGFFMSLPSFEKTLLKDTPAEIVSPSSNLIRSLISLAIFSPLPITIVEDGYVSEENLRKAEKDLAWLADILQEHHSALRDTLLLTVDQAGHVVYLRKEQP